MVQRRRGDIFALGKLPNPFFSICSLRRLLLKSVLVYVDFISYVSVFCMFVVFDMGRRMISPGPGEGAHPCIGEGILLFWLVKVSYLYSCHILLSCEVKKNSK